MLNRPLSKMPTNTIELCNYSFDMQPNLIKNTYYFVYQRNPFMLQIYKLARIWFIRSSINHEDLMNIPVTATVETT